MSLDQSLKRIREQVKEALVRRHTLFDLDPRDVERLLRDYDRMNAQLRLYYPQHVSMIRTALRKMVEAEIQLSDALAYLPPKELEPPEPPVYTFASRRLDL